MTGLWARNFAIIQKVLIFSGPKCFRSFRETGPSSANTPSFPGLLGCRHFFLAIAFTIDVVLLDVANVFRIWSKLTGYEELGPVHSSCFYGAELK